ncbi:hypothetical protein BFW01_g3852 [Lasiodiplodia theobromae]|nr:hypothetical protein BFW01_g3852 [Lasiodiplodia theobromae]
MSGPPEAKKQKTSHDQYRVTLGICIIQRLRPKIMRLSCCGPVIVPSGMYKTLTTHGETQQIYCLKNEWGGFAAEVPPHELLSIKYRISGVDDLEESADQLVGYFPAWHD